MLQQVLDGAGGGQRGCTHHVTSDALFLAPQKPAAQDTQPPGLGGRYRTELTSPEPQHQSRSRPRACCLLFPRITTEWQPQRGSHTSPPGIGSTSCPFCAIPPSPALSPTLRNESVEGWTGGREPRGQWRGGALAEGSRLCLLSPAHRQNRVPEPLHPEEVCLLFSRLGLRGSPREG